MDLFIKDTYAYKSIRSDPQARPEESSLDSSISFQPSLCLSLETNIVGTLLFDGFLQTRILETEIKGKLPNSRGMLLVFPCSCTQNAPPPPPPWMCRKNAYAVLASKKRVAQQLDLDDLHLSQNSGALKWRLSFRFPLKAKQEGSPFKTPIAMIPRVQAPDLGSRNCDKQSKGIPCSF